jgi:hypothetical protein
MKRKVAKKKQSKRKEPAQNPHHKRDFDRLIDDAIFGVKKKNPRG